MKTVKVSEETHSRLEVLCGKNVSFNNIITHLVNAFEDTEYIAVDSEGNWYELGRCKDCFEALEVAKKNEAYSPQAETKLFKGTLMLTTEYGDKEEEVKA